METSEDGLLVGGVATFNLITYCIPIAKCKKLSFVRSITNFTNVFAFSVILFSFLVGCSGNWLPNSILFLTRVYHQPFLTLEQCTHLTTFNEMGKVFSILFGGYVAKKFGRKKMLIYIVLINFVAWILLCSSTSTTFIYLARCLAGSPEGLFSVIGSISVAELSSPKYRGIFSSILSVSFNMGLLFEAFLSAAFGSYKTLNLVNAAISFCFMPTVFWFLESPYYLVHSRNPQKAEDNLRKVRPVCSEASFRKEFAAIEESVRGKDGVGERKQRRWWEPLRHKSTRKALFCAVVVSLAPTLTGGPQIRTFMSVVFPTNEFVSNGCYPLVFYTAAFVGSLLSILVLERAPRRPLAIVSCAIVCTLHCATGACCFLYERDGTPFWKWAFLGCNLLFVGLQAAIFTPLFDALRAEILPYSVKEIGNSFGLTLRSVALMISYKTFILMKESVGLFSNYALFAISAAGAAVFAYALLPETTGKSLADVQKELESNDREERRVEKY